MTAIVQDLARPRAASALASALRAPELAPAALVFALALAAWGLNLWVRLPFQTPDALLFVPLEFGLPFYMLCARSRFLRAPGEMVFYAALYATLGLAGVRLTYLGFAAGFPAQDATFARLDAALGFDWLAWRDFLHAHAWFSDLLGHAYGSHSAQALAAIVLLALFAPRAGNAVLVSALAIAVALTAAVFALLPSIGPAEAFGVAFPTAGVVEALRHPPVTAPLPLSGIVAFPSYHTAMALSFVMAYRRLPLLMIPAGALNALMLLSVPFSGNHYVVDMIGGAAVAGFAFWLADRLVARCKPAVTDS